MSGTFLVAYPLKFYLRTNVEAKLWFYCDKIVASLLTFCVKAWHQLIYIYIYIYIDTGERATGFRQRDNALPAPVGGY